MPVSYLCQNLTNTNFIGVIGQCFVQLALFNNFTLAGLLILSVFVGFMVRYSMPGNLLLPIACILTYTLHLLSGGNELFLGLFILTLLINGALIVMGLMNIINR